MRRRVLSFHVTLEQGLVLCEMFEVTAWLVDCRPIWRETESPLLDLERVKDASENRLDMVPEGAA